MVVRVVIVVAYLVVVAAVGLAARTASRRRAVGLAARKASRRRAGRSGSDRGRGAAADALGRPRRSSAESFFLAGRSLAPLALLATMAATNFSGFTVVGFSGAGYRLGLGFYPVMAFGTGLMAASFAFVGLPAWRLGRRFHLITPPELLTARFGSPFLTRIFAGAMIVFTLPYLAIQPMAAGYALESVLGLPYSVGAGLVTAVVLAYVLSGGMRSVVWTDIVQGVTMVLVMAVGLVAVLRACGGATAAFADTVSASPELMSRPGPGAALPLGIWASYMLLWTLADPMFPQLFQRFYAARNQRSLVHTMALYPVVTAVVFFFPVAIGVIGRLRIPGLGAGESDRVFPMLMESVGGDWLAALAAAGLVAGIMSTMDSQLLTLGSIVDGDVLAGGAGGRRGGEERAGYGRRARVTLALLSVAGYALSIRPPATILAIATETFSGLAVLLPSALAAIYWRRATARGAIASILVGEAAVVAYHFGLLPSFGLLPAVPATALSAVVLLAFGLGPRAGQSAPPGWFEEASPRLGRASGTAWALVLMGFAVLSVDWWRFGRLPRLLGWAPDWLVYFLVLSAALAVALAVLGRQLLRARGDS